MRRRIEIDRTAVTKTPVTEDITDMISKLAAWKPKTLEQVITVGERLIQAANEARFSGMTRMINGDKKKFFKSLEGKLVKYPNGIKSSTEYLFVDSVDFSDAEWDTTAKLTGVRLSKYNRIGNDTIQVYTLPVQFSNIVSTCESDVTINANGYAVTYEIVNDYAEYQDVYNRIHTVIDRANGMPQYLTRDMCKVSLTKKSFTKGKAKGDNKVEAKKQFNPRGKQWQIQPTSTTTDKETSKSCAEPSATTSSSPEMMGNGTAGRIRPKRVSAILARKSSKKSPPSSKSS